MNYNEEMKYPWYKQYLIDEVDPNPRYFEGSMFEMLENSALSRTSNIAYEYFGKSVTYGEFLYQVHSCAKSLKKMGIKREEKVMICLPNTPEAIIMFYAINAIGAIAVMVHPLSAEGEIKHFIKETKVKTALIADFSFPKFDSIKQGTTLRNVITCSVSSSMPFTMSVLYWTMKGRKTPKIPNKEGIYTWSSFMKLGNNYTKNYIVKRIGKDDAVILFSGGTTGIPKGIVLTNLNFNALATQADSLIVTNEDDAILGILPLFHGFGLGVCTHFFMCKGVKIYLIPQISPKVIADMLKNKKPTIIVGVPTLFEAIMNTDALKKIDLSFIKHTISGGDKLSPDLKNRFDKFLKDHKSKTVIREGYGLTESVTACCVTPEFRHKENSIGIPFPGMFMKIVDVKTKEDVPFGTEGEICVAGPTIMKGYLNYKKETKMVLEKHKDGKLWLHTGDLGKMDEDGYFYFILRLKRMIISSGYNVYPSQIENILNTYPDVDSSVVVGVPDPYKQQRVKAVIVLKPGVEESEKLLEDLKSLCKKNIAKYALPSEYEFKAQLPKTLVGKIDYKELEK